MRISQKEGNRKFHSILDFIKQNIVEQKISFYEIVNEFMTFSSCTYIAKRLANNA